MSLILYFSLKTRFFGKFLIVITQKLRRYSSNRAAWVNYFGSIVKAACVHMPQRDVNIRSEKQLMGLYDLVVGEKLVSPSRIRVQRSEL